METHEYKFHIEINGRSYGISNNYDFYPLTVPGFCSFMNSTEDKMFEFISKLNRYVQAFVSYICTIDQNFPHGLKSQSRSL